MKQKVKCTPQARKNKIREYTSAYLMLAPSLIMFILFVVYPLVWVLTNMFFDTDGASYRIFCGMENFKLMFQDKYWWNAVKNTLELALKLIIFQLPIALVLAAILNENIKFKGAFRFVYYMPTILPGAVMGLILSMMFSPYNGVINEIIKDMGLPEVNWVDNAGAAMWSCVIMTVWQVFGGNMLYFLSGLQGISPSVYESASLDGASKIKQFFYITIPMLTPILKIVLMLSIISSLQIMETVMILTGGGPNHGTETMPLYIYRQFFSESTMPRFGYGSALGAIASIIIGAITIVYNLVSKKMDDVL